MGGCGRTAWRHADAAAVFQPRPSAGFGGLRDSLGGRRHPKITAFALDSAGYFQQATQGLSGVTCFSATLHPLPEMRLLLGGAEDDACFAMPSPFPPEHLQIRQVDVNTRYAHRSSACTEIVRQITALVTRKPGKYLVFFPSFAFLRMTAERLMLPCQVQEKQMDEAARAAFLDAYRQEGGDALSLCVLGGVFSEGLTCRGGSWTAWWSSGSGCRR